MYHERELPTIGSGDFFSSGGEISDVVALIGDLSSC